MQTAVCTDKHYAAGVQLRASSAVAGNETLEALRHRQRLEARAAEEEDLMVRVPLSKEQKKQLKADRRVNLSGAAMMNDFADDVADLVGVSSLSRASDSAPEMYVLQQLQSLKGMKGMSRCCLCSSASNIGVLSLQA